MKYINAHNSQISFWEMDAGGEFLFYFVKKNCWG